MFDTANWTGVDGTEFNGGSLLDASGEWVYSDWSDVGEYRTVFGPCFPSAVCFNAEGGISYLNAATALLGVRKPDQPGLHERLIKNQEEWSKDGLVSDWKRDMRTRVTGLFEAISADHAGNVAQDAAKPHDKLKLRLAAWARSIMGSSGLDFDKIESARGAFCSAQYKKQEGLPKREKSRMTVDLTTVRSLIGGYLMEAVKTAFTIPYVVNDCSAVFVASPSGLALSRAFEKLVSGDRAVEFIFYSDDSCYCIRCSDGEGGIVLLKLNVDISGCDASNYKPVFDIGYNIMSGLAIFARIALILFMQLTLNIKFVVKEDDFTRKRKQVFKPRHMRLYSGSVLTTFINNVANMLIFLSMVKLYTAHVVAVGTPPTTSEAVVMLTTAAAAAGYCVTCEVCECDEQIQFLKRSFTMVNGRAVTWMNLGVWMLKFGSTPGDLPGSQRVPLAERARQFNAGVVRGRIHDGDHVIADAFKHAFLDREGVGKSISTDYHGGVGSDGRVPVEALARRYSVPVGDIQHLAGVIAASRVGQAIVSRVAERIILVDYGVSWGPQPHTQP